MLIHGWQVCTKTVLNTMYINYNTPQNSTHNYWGGGGGGGGWMVWVSMTKCISFHLSLIFLLVSLRLSPALSLTLSLVCVWGGVGGGWLGVKSVTKTCQLWHLPDWMIYCIIHAVTCQHWTNVYLTWETTVGWRRSLSMDHLWTPFSKCT